MKDDTLRLIGCILLAACSGEAEPGLGEQSQDLEREPVVGGRLYLCSLGTGSMQPGSADCDGDGLINADEAALGTAIANADTDQDGIEDGWEVNGAAHPLYSGGVPVFVDYPALGCDPLRRDLLIEVDYHDSLDAAGVRHSAQLSTAVRGAVASYFAALPIANPDGTSGIRVLLVDDEQLGAPNGVIDAVPPGTTPANFDCYVSAPGTQGDQSTRAYPRETFRKLAVCVTGSGWRGNSVPGSGAMKYQSAESNNTNPLYGETDDMTEVAQFLSYSTLLHELGHSLGILHGGYQDNNFKVNYPSLMNYKYSKSLCGSPWTLAGTRIGYSRGTLPDLDACNLSEQSPFPGLSFAEHCFLDDGSAGASFERPFAHRVDAAGNVVVDWDRDGVQDAAPVAGAITGWNPLGLPAICAAGGSHWVRDSDDIARIERCMRQPLIVAQGKPPISGCP